jgi:hypothetical protein
MLKNPPLWSFTWVKRKDRIRDIQKCFDTKEPLFREFTKAPKQ